MPSCFSCGHFLEETDRLGRRDTCENCHVDLHCCKNCRFYDLSSYNECQEPQAERVLEKEKGNFCDYFELGEGRGTSEKDNAIEGKKKLERLFRKI